MQNRRPDPLEYRELFAALFKIKDKEIHKRVIDAINGINRNCPNCKEVETCHASTQTIEEDDDSSISSDLRFLIPETSLKVVDNETNEEVHFSMKRKLVKVDATEPIDSILKRKKRKKINKVPHVEKSQANEVEKRLAADSVENKKTEIQKAVIDALKYIDVSMINNCENIILAKTKEELTKEDVCKQMIEEYRTSEMYDECGYLPIHKAIIDGDISKFRRQCYVFHKKCRDFDEILTESGENLLQLGLKTDTLPKILEQIIEKMSDFKCIDNSGNTLLHLAMKYTDNSHILRILLEKIDDIDFLMMYDDDGRSILHIGAFNDKCEMCKTILNYINEKTENEFLKMPKDGTNEELVIQYLYKQVYTKVNNMQLKFNETKFKIVNQKDLKHGRTPLFFALASKAHVIIFLLILNLAYPGECDRSGINCISFVKEIPVGETRNFHMPNFLQCVADSFAKQFNLE